MATDLYLINDLPRLRSLSISSPTVTELTATISDLTDSPLGAAAAAAGGDEECKTPTSAIHRIPPISSCPPAPRKQRPTASCKRKLSELQFFEIVSSAEVDELFNRSGILHPTVARATSAAAPKKRRVFKRIVSETSR